MFLFKQLCNEHAEENEWTWNSEKPVLVVVSEFTHPHFGTLAPADIL